MAVIHNSRLQRQHDEEGEDLELVALKYTGTQSVYNTESVRGMGGFPGRAAFQRDQWTITMLPDTGLGWWESHQDFEIAYDAQTIAHALTQRNFLPEQIFGPGYDTGLRDRVFEKLDLEPAYDNEEYREQLAGIAGVDTDEVADDNRDAGTIRQDDLMGEYSRQDLMVVAGEFEDIDESIEDRSGASKSEYAEYLADKDDDRVDRLLDRRERGDL